MNNEDTIIMQPQNDNRWVKNETKRNKKSETGGKVAVTAAAAAVGGMVGSGATYAATAKLHDSETTEQEQEIQNMEEPVATVADEPTENKQPEANTAPETQETEIRTDDEPNTETDYTDNNGADPVMVSPQVHAATNDDSGNDSSEVQVLGIYEAQGDCGQTMQAAVLTNGQEVAAVVDVDGNGIADVIAVDYNHNQQIDEGEIHDISDYNIHMSDYQQTYISQLEQEQLQQEQETFVINDDSEQTDFDNNADPQFPTI